MASKQAAKRLGKEYQSMQKSPPPFVWARPNESNVLEWHYILRGPSDSPYFGQDYPFAPPTIKMMTPSGRFAPSQAICTSMSSFHPSTWNPAWSVNTILVGLLSFMLGDEITTGSVRTTDAEKQALAKASHAWNVQQPRFKTHFPEYSSTEMKDLPVMGSSGPPPPPESAAVATSSTSTTTTTTTTTSASNPVHNSSSRSLLDQSFSSSSSASENGTKDPRINPQPYDARPRVPDPSCSSSTYLHPTSTSTHSIDTSTPILTMYDLDTLRLLHAVMDKKEERKGRRRRWFLWAFVVLLVSWGGMKVLE
ncbi:BQ2448_2234 [Microbotryum intermedium]|uniref:BQ2448_2234 protein n=1 Tax=Microbotryum intermedium TaxID=269621 RepID=A0A238FBD8_9BASI|nr:BQ2448_2234 [Microbotryum intermedium]